MITELTLAQAFALPLCVGCAAGAAVCFGVLAYSLIWEYRRAAYRRALRRYQSAQQSLLLAGHVLRVVWHS